MTLLNFIDYYNYKLRLAMVNTRTNVTLLAHAAIDTARQTRPLLDGKVCAGMSRFPSAARDYEQKDLDLNERFVRNPPATFYFTVEGDSMTGIGIFDGSILIVDRSIKPKSSDIVIAVVDGELLVKRLYKRGDLVRLLSENPAYPPIEFTEGQELIVQGVVTYVISQPK